MDIRQLEDRLDSLDSETRKAALGEIEARLKRGEISTPDLCGFVNVHLHTCFSFNADGHSPSRLVWEAKKAGLDVVGAVDFDVLDAMGEFLAAGDVLEVRANVALESRVYMKEYASRDINSPGEAGVAYFMGTGFTSLPEKGSEAEKTLAMMRRGARERNVAMLERLRATLAPLQIDYAADVESLTPSGNATERHMLEALDNKSRQAFADEKKLAAYWMEKLELPAEKVTALLKDVASFRNAIRAKLMKRGGAGYAQPTEKTFPPVEEVVKMTLHCGAIPCGAWLDGTSSGEADAGVLLDSYGKLGCLAFNIIPDRNWNISDPAAKKTKVAKLAEIMAEARKRNLILSVGTEKNSYGQKFVDSFDAPELAPYADDFRDGAYILYGHTLLQSALRQGRVSAWARDTFGEDAKKANDFYLQVGLLGFPAADARQKLASLGQGATPGKILNAL